MMEHLSGLLISNSVQEQISLQFNCASAPPGIVGIETCDRPLTGKGHEICLGLVGRVTSPKELSWESKVPPPKLPPPRNKALIASLIKGNQWLIAP